MRAANSAAYARTRPAREVKDAVMYIGTKLATQVVLTAAVKPLLSLRRGDTLWCHSVESAVVAELLAQRTRDVDPHEAYVLGLFHDIGKLLLNIAPARAQECKNRMTSKGVPEQVAEILTYGADHAMAGELVARNWRLPEDYTEGIRHHHQPDHSDSQLAALLYLVEFCTDSEEDIPSDVRLRSALDRVGLTISDVNVKPRETENYVAAVV
jgi:HD-like signal output (HDOD) protein